MNKIVEMFVNWKKKTIEIVQPQEMQLEIREDGYFTINTEEVFKKEIAKQPEQLFEEEIEVLLNVEQEIRLYRSWSTALSIMIGRTADIVEIPRNLAKQIIILAQGYGLLYEGNNYTWKVIKEIRSRWLDRAKEKENNLKDPNTISRIPSTPQESIDRLAKMSTPKQKAKARGEAYIEKDIVEEVEESPIEVVREGLYSPAKEAKEREKKIRDEQIKRDSEQYKREANSKDAQPILPKCVRVIGVIEEKEKEKLKKQRK